MKKLVSISLVFQEEKTSFFIYILTLYLIDGVS